MPPPATDTAATARCGGPRSARSPAPAPARPPGPPPTATTTPATSPPPVLLRPLRPGNRRRPHRRQPLALRLRLHRHRHRHDQIRHPLLPAQPHELDPNRPRPRKPRQPDDPQPLRLHRQQPISYTDPTGSNWQCLPGDPDCGVETKFTTGGTFYTCAEAGVGIVGGLFGIGAGLVGIITAETGVGVAFGGLKRSKQFRPVDSRFPEALAP